MQFVRTRELPDIIVVEPDIYRDDRGLFFETYHAEKYQDGGIPGPFVQDNQSRSARHTLRGLHAQYRRPQGKLLRVLQGAIYDVAVDIRRGSPTFARWVAVELSADNFRQVYVPPGFAHGFCVLSETAEVEYKCTDFYDPDGALYIRWNDPAIGVPWPVREPVLSPQDRTGQRLADVEEKLPVFVATG